MKKVYRWKFIRLHFAYSEYLFEIHKKFWSKTLNRSWIWFGNTHVVYGVKLNTGRVIWQSRKYNLYSLIPTFLGIFEKQDRIQGIHCTIQEVIFRTFDLLLNKYIVRRFISSDESVYVCVEAVCVYLQWRVFVNVHRRVCIFP